MARIVRQPGETGMECFIKRLTFGLCGKYVNWPWWFSFNSIEVLV